MKLLCTLFFTLFSIHLALSQGGRPNEEDMDNIKALRLKNIEKDTYVVFDEGYTLDRYEMKPPFVFNFSDGQERRVYLFKVYENEEMKELGILAMYYKPNDQTVINILQPAAGAAKEAWGKYIDELKYRGQEEEGLLPCVSFAFSKEMSNLYRTLQTGEQASVDEEEGEYEYCFVAGTLVTLANGDQVPIEQLQEGQEVLGLGTEGQVVSATITEVSQHKQVSTSLVTLYLHPKDELQANLDTKATGFFSLTGTYGHPLVVNGKKIRLGEVSNGQSLAGVENDQQVSFSVSAVLTLPSQRTTVYNISTTSGNYLANGVWVSDKK